jgi:hypothetical protein
MNAGFGLVFESCRLSVKPRLVGGDRSHGATFFTKEKGPALFSVKIFKKMRGQTQILILVTSRVVLASGSKK